MPHRNFTLLASLILIACSTNPASKPKVKAENMSSDNVKETVRLPAKSEMVLFQGGTFTMGTNTGPNQEQPAHQVEVKSFSIDKYPVTVADFRKFVEATGHKTDAEKFGDSGVFDFNSNSWTLQPGATWQFPLGKNTARAADDHPVTQVSWYDATAYANWAGKRLPTEAEWEYAARCGGKSTTRFSWGDNLLMEGKYMANVWQGSDLSSKQGADGFALTSPVGYYGLTPCGMADMGGNVWNWCADEYKSYPGNNAPSMPNPELRVIRGGSFFFDQNGEASFTSTGRASNSRETSLFNTGFRCAADAK
jgi:formylglycine-generating enzyme